MIGFGIYVLSSMVLTAMVRCLLAAATRRCLLVPRLAACLASDSWSAGAHRP